MENAVVTIEPIIQPKTILRVAAYCRVSSDSSDQLNSFAAQVQHYTKFIDDNERMELADIYADEGITGTKTSKRDDFNRLIADCKKEKLTVCLQNRSADLQEIQPIRLCMHGF